MSIWENSFGNRALVEVPENVRLHAPWTPYHPEACTFCNEPLSVFRREAVIETERWQFPCSGMSSLRLCLICGWWTVAFDYRVDLGLDVDLFVFDGQANDLIGIQVKRWRNKIEAEQIREFAGALVLNGATRGVYVTASTYRTGAEQTARTFTSLGIPIELWDAGACYDRLKITSREPYSSPGDPTAMFAPFWQEPARMPQVMSEGCGRG